MTIGPWEIVIILLVLVVIFGAGRLSQMGSAVGKSVREFRSAVQHEPTQAVPQQTVTITAPPVVCAACQAVNPATNKFCSACGAELVSAPANEPASTAAAPETTCPSCATVNPAKQAFCGQCGTRLTRAA
jgi:sec-independent protein translocase protein TatA